MKSFFTNFLKGTPVLFLAVGIHLIGTEGPAWGAVLIDRVVAVVNREIITQSELDELAHARKMEIEKELADRSNSSGSPFGTAAEVQRDLLNETIEKKLILQEAKKRGVRITESELEMALRDIEGRNQFPSREAFQEAISRENLSWEKYLDDLKNQLTILKLMNREIDSNLALTDQEVQAYYDTRSDLFIVPDEIRLKQILFRLPPSAAPEAIDETRRKAEQVLKEAQGGGDFDRLVEQHSEGSERRQGGDLGSFKKGELTPEIDRVVFTLKPGTVSPLVQSAVGFHIFKVQNREGVRRQPLERVRKEVEERLIFEKREALRKKWLDEIWSRSFVDVK